MPLVEHSWTAVRHATAAAPPTETVFVELGRRARPAGLSIAGYLFLVAMLISVALAARRIVSCGRPGAMERPAEIATVSRKQKSK